MITVTRLNHTELVVNADLIEFVESLPDTYLTLVTGKKLMVCETPAQIIERVLEYRRAAGPMLRRPVNMEHLTSENVVEHFSEDENLNGTRA
jgi:flagellar protein FlbD